jgi:hypothetical protein
MFNAVLDKYLANIIEWMKNELSPTIEDSNMKGV